MNIYRVFLVVKLLPTLRSYNPLFRVLALGVVTMLAWRLTEVIQTTSPYHVSLILALVTLVLVVQGLPTREEYNFLRTISPAVNDRILYVSLSLAWSSCAPLFVGLLIPILSLARGLDPPIWLGLISISVWLVFSVTGGIIAERLKRETIGIRIKRTQSILPAWYRKEAGLTLTRGSDWLGPVLAIAGAFVVFFVAPLMTQGLQTGTTRVIGLLLGPFLAEPFVLNTPSAEGKCAWLHAVAQEPARRFLIRKGLVGVIHVYLWHIPFIIALSLTLPGPDLMTILAQVLSSSLGICFLALVLGTRLADLSRAEMAQRLPPIRGLLVVATFFVYEAIWITNARLGYLQTAVIVVACAVWLWKQKAFTSLHLWRTQCR